jgi:hypothetical protein
MLASASDAGTLLDDWLMRRQRLAASESVSAVGRVIDHSVRYVDMLALRRMVAGFTQSNLRRLLALRAVAG